MNRQQRNYLAQEGILPRIGNFLLNIFLAITWLGRWTIKQVRKFVMQRSK